MTIGARIKQRRVELGLTADVLAERIGKSRATIYRYENGDIEDMPTTILEPLAEALHTSPAFLMGWEKRTVGWNIKKHRTEQGLSPNELATMSGVSESNIISYENEKNKPSFESLINISSALGIYIGNLIEDWSEYPESKNYDPFSFATPVESFSAGVHRKAIYEEKRLLQNYRSLNAEGKKEARKRIQELTEIKKYTYIEQEEYK